MVTAVMKLYKVSETDNGNVISSRFSDTHSTLFSITLFVLVKSENKIQRNVSESYIRMS